MHLGCLCRCRFSVEPAAGSLHLPRLDQLAAAPGRQRQARGRRRRRPPQAGRPRGAVGPEAARGRRARAYSLLVLDPSAVHTAHIRLVHGGRFSGLLHGFFFRVMEKIKRKYDLHS